MYIHIAVQLTLSIYVMATACDPPQNKEGATFGRFLAMQLHISVRPVLYVLHRLWHHKLPSKLFVHFFYCSMQHLKNASTKEELPNEASESFSIEKDTAGQPTLRICSSHFACLALVWR